MNKQKYNLFLDDERFPYNTSQDAYTHCDSAYDLTNNVLYKNLTWFIVRNFEQFVNTIEKLGLPECISFDHDLKDKHYYYYQMYTAYTGTIDYTVLEGTGYECAKWLVNYILNHDLTTPTILIHTQNVVGGENIKKLFENLQKK